MKKTLLTVAAASFLFVLAGCSDNTNPPAVTATPAGNTSGGVVLTATPVVGGTTMAPVTATATPGAPGTETPAAPPGTETPAAPGGETPAPTATP